MDLYLLRHGIAEPGRPGLPDSRRKLTSRGVRRIRKVARGMNAMNLRIDIALSSPSERAQRTAGIVAKELRIPLAFEAHLRPGGDQRRVIQSVCRLRGRPRSVLLVGHEPMLSCLASVLLTGTASTPIVLKKGGLCKLTAGTLRYGKCATLQWLLAPRQSILLSR